MDLPPVWVANACVLKTGIITGGGAIHRNGQPRQSGSSFDPVAVTPIPVCVFHRIQQHECVHGVDHMEIPLPGDVVWLEDRNFHDGIYIHMRSLETGDGLALGRR